MTKNEIKSLHEFTPAGPLDLIKNLADLKDSGAITEQEVSKKTELLKKVVTVSSCPATFLSLFHRMAGICGVL